jgi:hypothetical protein
MLENEEFCTVSTINKDVVLQFGAFSGSAADMAFNVESATVGTLSGVLNSQTFEIQSGSVTMFGMTVNVTSGEIAFASDASSGSGAMVLDISGQTIEMSLSLTKGACQHDVLPYLTALPTDLITSNYMSLDNMKSVSKFRSGAGHEFVDDFETCRSMKHYYSFLDATDFSTRDAAEIYAPFDGVITATSVEELGVMFHIQSIDYPSIWVELFHVELDPTLEVGDTVTSGQQIGTHYAYEVSGGNSDIAIWVRRPDGYRLISQFEVMSAGVLAEFTARGVSDWATELYFADDAVANPHLGAGGLQCLDQEFVSGTDVTRDYFEFF